MTNAMLRFLLVSLSALALTGAAQAEVRFDISLSAALGDYESGRLLLFPDR